MESKIELKYCDSIQLIGGFHGARCHNCKLLYYKTRFAHKKDEYRQNRYNKRKKQGTKYSEYCKLTKSSMMFDGLKCHYRIINE